MRLYPFVIPRLLQNLYPSLTWTIKNEEKAIYLTFDDGPHPEITHWVINLLDKYNAKATFFVVGENVNKFPETYQKLISKGHAVGNHTYHHISGYSQKATSYINDVAKCKELVDSKLFRPPYGRIKRSQIKVLEQDYKIVMWNQLSGDFDKNLDTQSSLNSLKRNAKAGNVVVFHDSEKSFAQLKKILEPYLIFLKEEGFICKVITP